MAMNPYLFLPPIGYLRFSDFLSIVDISNAVYLAPLTESINGPTPAQHIEDHYIMVTQLDIKGCVHYYRVLVVRLVYHNGIAFAPDYGAQILKVDQVRYEIEERLTREGFIVRAGMVALPQGMLLVEGNL